MSNDQQISDVVPDGQVVAGGPGEGPDGAFVIVWQPQHNRFVVWETHDGAT